MVEVKMARKVLPVIMCGGAGTRVWPESREIHAEAVHSADRHGFDLPADNQAP